MTGERYSRVSLSFTNANSGFEGGHGNFGTRICRALKNDDELEVLDRSGLCVCVSALYNVERRLLSPTTQSNVASTRNLVYEYQVKKQREKEEQKRIREQMREEARLLREVEEARQSLEKEEKHFNKAIQDFDKRLIEA